MPLFPPLFAKGKTNAKNITNQTVGSADTALTLDSVSGLTVGLHCFTSADAGAGSIEYLGKIKSIDGSVVTVQFRARFSRSSGADFWTPAASWQAATVISLGSQDRTVDRGIVNLETTSAHKLRTKVRDRAEYIEMMWSMANKSDLNAMEAWLLTNAGDGLGLFTCAFADRTLGYVRSCKVAIDDINRPQKGKRDACELLSWINTMAIVASDSYL